MDGTNDFRTIAIEQDGAVATIYLDRPEKLNAFTPEMYDEMIAAVQHCDRDDTIGAVIVTGRGRAFCAGADLSAGRFEASTTTISGATLPRDPAGHLTLTLFDSLKPIIAAINGPAVGVGATLTLAMDVRLASTGAKCAFSFARRGIVPDGASSWFLPHVVGLPTALEWALTGQMVPAEDMLARGLVSALHDPDELLDAARAVAQEIVDNVAPVSVALTRQLLWRMSSAPHPMAAHVAESRGLFERTRSADAAEGVGAFFDKRPAAFQMKVSTELPEIFDGASPAFPAELIDERYLSPVEYAERAEQS